MVITKKSNYTDEAFKFIEILIDDELPYFTELNVSITVRKIQTSYNIFLNIFNNINYIYI